jgi:hypothetical protein
MTGRRRWHRAEPQVRALAERGAALTSLQSFSIGLKSGEYGGRNRARVPACSRNRTVAEFLWGERLSITTTSRCSTGTSPCFIQARNNSPSIGPSNIQGACGPWSRTAEIALWQLNATPHRWFPAGPKNYPLVKSLFPQPS